MNRLSKMIGIICLASSASGCGTISNTGGLGNQPDYRIYGGVRVDAERFAEVVVDGFTRKKEEQTESEHGYLTMFFLTDLPLSFVADILTLPWVIYRQIAPPPESERARRANGERSETDTKVDQQVPNVQTQE